MDLAGAEQWKSSLTTMFTGYDLRNAFNMDETGFFFRALPDSTLNHVAQSYLDEYFKQKGRKALLFLDNAPVHTVDGTTNLTNVELCYSPPSPTSPQFFSLLMLALSRKFEGIITKIRGSFASRFNERLFNSCIRSCQKTDSSGRNQVYEEILGLSYGRDNPEMFCRMRFCCSRN
ncbi:hypothetical protein BASA61_001751 [Batrachochytrium salamandrivorans]|nr:hypothetical protein BASA61_001751 [Batrachochytrium salamandrivorans]